MNGVSEFDNTTVTPRAARLANRRASFSCSGRHRQQILDVADLRIHVPAEGDVELALAIDAIQAVETGPVEEDRPGRRFERREARGLNRAHLVEVLLGGLVLAERVDQITHVVADDPIGRDQIGVDVGDDGAIRLEREEDRAAADERLVIATEAFGEPLEDRGYELALASGPLEKWSGTNLWMLIGKRCRPHGLA